MPALCTAELWLATQGYECCMIHSTELKQASLKDHYIGAFGMGERKQRQKMLCYLNILNQAFKGQLTQSAFEGQLTQSVFESVYSQTAAHLGHIQELCQCATVQNSTQPRHLLKRVSPKACKQPPLLRAHSLRPHVLVHNHTVASCAIFSLCLFANGRQRSMRCGKL
jgi:hypothetical protein